MKLLLSSIAAIATATAAFAFEISLSSGTIPFPNEDGSFSETSTQGRSVRHAYYLITAGKYANYMVSDSPSNAIYADFLAGADGWTTIVDYPSITSGFSVFDLSSFISDENWFDYDEEVYLAAVFVNVNELKPATNFIARAISFRTPTEEDDDEAMDEEGVAFNLMINNIATDAGRWEVVAAAPPAPLEIECTNIAVSGGTVTVTYQVSDISGFAVGSTVNFSVAYSLARNASGALATETLSGTINSIDATASTFTATLSPPANTTSLFILGIDD